MKRTEVPIRHIAVISNPTDEERRAPRAFRIGSDSEKRVNDLFSKHFDFPLIVVVNPNEYFSYPGEQ